MNSIKGLSLLALLMLVGCGSSSSESVSVDDAKEATKQRADEPAAEAGPVMTLERPK
ncbi:MAG: hypothetical protein WCH39_09620 [Schlesneria sp.]